MTVTCSCDWLAVFLSL